MAADTAAPAVSVLLPVLNGRSTLAAAVGSILSQSFADFELLVLDDGSTDGSGDLARGIGDNRVRVIGDETRRGLAARLNQGIDLARGRYIARMDADDVAFPARLARQVTFLEAHPEIDLVGCRVVAFRHDRVLGVLQSAPDHHALTGQPWRGIPLAHPSWLGRAEWFRAHHYAIPEVARAEDQELLLRACPTSRYACLDDVLLAYRQGRFALRRTLIARRHLLRAQLGHFRRRRQWGNAALALAATVVKVAFDLVARLPGCERVFFARMAGTVPAEVLAALHTVGVRPGGGGTPAAAPAGGRGQARSGPA